MVWDRGAGDGRGPGPAYGRLPRTRCDAPRVPADAPAIILGGEGCANQGSSRAQERSPARSTAAEDQVALVHEGPRGFAMVLGHAAARVVPGLEVEQIF